MSDLVDGNDMIVFDSGGLAPFAFKASALLTARSQLRPQHLESYQPVQLVIRLIDDPEPAGAKLFADGERS